MDIEAISGAAAVALGCAILFLLIGRSWQAFVRNVGPGPRFSDSIMHEAAQHLREELQTLTSKQSTYLGGAMAFVLVFGVAYTFRAQELFSGYPRWQMYVLLALLVVAALLAAWRLVCTMHARGRVRLQHDANVAVGHQLRQIAPGTSRVYHEVPTSAGIVDHVVVGTSGIYAVNVVARRPSSNGAVELAENGLCFSPSGHTASIVELAAKSNRLGRELSKALGHKIRVRSVLAVPGWQIAKQTDENHLLVNERTLGMIKGWRDSSDNLMNDDVAAIQADLTRRCSGRG